jgi:hypothetical protein
MAGPNTHKGTFIHEQGLTSDFAEKVPTPCGSL